MGIQVGKVLAKADPTTAQWIKSATKGTRGLEMYFVIEPKEPGAGERVKYTAWFAATTQERSVESLQHAGCTFPSGKISDLTGLGSKVAQIDIEQEMYNGQPKGLRVAWVNDPSAGGKPMAQSDLDDFDAEMAQVLSLAKSNAGRSGSSTTSTEDVGF